jgi:hypothetical protein
MQARADLAYETDYVSVVRRVRIASATYVGLLNAALLYALLEAEVAMRRVILNVGILAATWVLGLALVRWFGGSLASDAIILLVFLAGALLSLVLQAKFAGYLLGAIGCWQLAEFGAQIVLGHQSIQGRGAHLAAMTAALTGTLVGAAIASGTLLRVLTAGKRTEAPPSIS